MYVISPMFLVCWLKHIKYNKIMILLGLNYSNSFHLVLSVALEKFQDGNTKMLSVTVPSMYHL